MMKKRVGKQLLGGKFTREPIELLSGVFYISLLSVYEAILCEKESRKLLERLIADGADQRISKSVAENAVLTSLCLYNEKDKLVFKDGFNALSILTPEELLKVANKYAELQKNFLTFDKLTPSVVRNLKKN